MTTSYAGNDQSATEFASRMQDGEPIGQAWLESTWYADNSNAPTFMNTGRDANDCWNRSKVTLPTLFGTPSFGIQHWLFLLGELELIS